MIVDESKKVKVVKVANLTKQLHNLQQTIDSLVAKKEYLQQQLVEQQQQDIMQSMQRAQTVLGTKRKRTAEDDAAGAVASGTQLL